MNRYIYTPRATISLFRCTTLALSAFLIAAPISAQTWSPVAALNTNAATDDLNEFYPNIATDGAGTWITIWEAGVVVASRSLDNGATWSAPIVVSDDTTADRCVQIAYAGNGEWIALWDSVTDLNGTIGTDRDILHARSGDNGLTWSAPLPLNTNAAVDAGSSDRKPRFLSDGAGTWIALWESSESFGGTIGNDWDIFFARSTDNGLTWTDPAILNSNAAVDTMWDFHPRPATDGFGNWVVVWQSQESLGDTIGKDYDILFVRSSDNGETWSDTAPLNTNAATDVNSDLDPSIATDTFGTWVVTWSSHDSLDGTIGNDYDILVARSTDNGATWSPPVPLNSNAATDPFDDKAVRLATDTIGNWIAIWESNNHVDFSAGTDIDFFYAHSTDGGLTWTPLQFLNTTATSDGTATDRFGSIVADAQGNWIVAWESNADLGGVTGGEGDILYTTRSFPPVLDRDNVYVDFNASTNGNGLPQTPFHNLADAIAVVNPAGIVHVAPGVSSEVFDGPAALGQQNGPYTLQKQNGSGAARIGTP